MKLHDLKPAAGSKKERTRVGRGIAAGKGKTAGRGTKGQKSRAGGTIPPFFEGGQTPLHIRIPKLHGFKNRFRVEYQVVNVGRLSAYAEAGRFQEASGQDAVRATGPLTVNPELLRAAGLISSMRVPVKVLGQGEVSQALFVVADAFTKGAREKLEAAGGTAQQLVVPDRPMPALRLDEDGAPAAARPARRPRASELAAQATADEKARAQRADKVRTDKAEKSQQGQKGGNAPQARGSEKAPRDPQEPVARTSASGSEGAPADAGGTAPPATTRSEPDATADEAPPTPLGEAYAAGDEVGRSSAPARRAPAEPPAG